MLVPAAHFTRTLLPLTPVPTGRGEGRDQATERSAQAAAPGFCRADVVSPPARRACYRPRDAPGSQPPPRLLGAKSERPRRRRCRSDETRAPTSAIRWTRASAASRRDDESECRRRRGWRSDAWQRHSEAEAAARAEAVAAPRGPSTPGCARSRQGTESAGPDSEQAPSRSRVGRDRTDGRAISITWLLLEGGEVISSLPR